MIEYKSINHAGNNTLDAREGTPRGQSLEEQSYQNVLEQRLAEIERELQDTKVYYQAKVSHLERQLLLQGGTTDPLLASFGGAHHKLSYGERQRFLD